MSARAELALRQRLAQREERITHLKQARAGGAAASQMLRCRILAEQLPAGSHPRRAAVPAAPAASPEAAFSEEEDLAAAAADQVTELRIELARRGAQVEQLQAALSEAVASQQTPSHQSSQVCLPCRDNLQYFALRVACLDRQCKCTPLMIHYKGRLRH